MKRGLFSHLLSLFCSLSLLPTSAAADNQPPAPSARMDLPVIKTVARHPPYKDFCRRNPGECDLTGVEAVELDPGSWKSVRRVNGAVNQSIYFALDSEQYNTEEYWSYPRSGWGDCEDQALEKRRRLVKLGIPRSALRLAIAFHQRKLHSHCLLTIETNEGTLVLDSLSDDILLWHQAPYNYEQRERSDGRWERFDQRSWSFQEQVSPVGGQ